MNQIERTVIKRFIQVVALIILIIGLTIIIIAIKPKHIPLNSSVAHDAELYIIRATEPYIEIAETTEQITDSHDPPPEAIYYIPHEIILEWAEEWAEMKEAAIAAATTKAAELATAIITTESATAAPRRIIKEGDIIIGEATHYAVCCDCDEPNTKATASGYIIQNGIQCYTATCNWLPLGSVIEVNGEQYTIRDRGGRWFNTIGNIDIFVPDGKETALEIGRLKNIEIKIVYLPG